MSTAEMAFIDTTELQQSKSIIDNTLVHSQTFDLCVYQYCLIELWLHLSLVVVNALKTLSSRLAASWGHNSMVGVV